jgi:hypothetical protein
MALHSLVLLLSFLLVQVLHKLVELGQQMVCRFALDSHFLAETHFVLKV